MQIGNVKIIGYCALAPMAGVADRAFRELCKSYGAAYTAGEMVSAQRAEIITAPAMVSANCV